MKTISALLAAFLCSASAHATLIDRGNGLIYDDILHVTWLQDANYAKTSGYSINGKMTWEDANTWAAGLNYAGYDDWRLPITSYPTGYLEQNQSVGYSKTATSEMAYMYYANFGLLSGSGVPSGAANVWPFINTQNSGYFSGTAYPSGTVFGDSSAWYFRFDSGYQDYTYKWDAQYAWAVRDGDVTPTATVPAPPASILMLTGLAALATTRRRATLQQPSPPSASAPHSA